MENLNNSICDELKLVKPYNVYDFINCFDSFLNDSLGVPPEHISSIFYKDTLHRFVKFRLFNNLFSINVSSIPIMDNRKIIFSLMAGDISLLHIGFFDNDKKEYILDDNYILDTCETNLETLNYIMKNTSVVDIKDRENLFNQFI